MNIIKQIKLASRGVSSKFINSRFYWIKSPSIMLLYAGANDMLAKYATNKKVLDAGAGRLVYKKVIEKYAKDYVSVDFRKTHPDLDLVEDIENLSSIKNNSFDVVFCSQVIEHLPHPPKAFAEFNRVLKPSGVLVLTAPLHGYIHNAPYDFFRYTKYGLELMAKEAGLKVFYLKELGGFFCYLGYIRSSILLPFFGLRLVGALVLYINYLLSKLDIVLDRITFNQKIFTLNYLLVAKKR